MSLDARMKGTISVRTWLLLVLIVTLGGLAAACSSGDDDTSPTPTSSTLGLSDGTDTPPGGTDSDNPPATLEPGQAGQPGQPGNGDAGQPGGLPPLLPPTPTLGGVMRLTIIEGGFCEANECFASISSTFTLAVEVLSAPSTSYILMQTFLDFGVYDPDASEDDAGPGTCSDGVGNGGRDGVDRLDEDCVKVELVYVASERAADEIVWADLNEGTGLRAELGPGLLMHGGLTGLIPPLPTSNETGIVVQFQMMCPATATRVPMTLLVYDDPVAKTNGSAFVQPDSLTKMVPQVAPITLICR